MLIDNICVIVLSSLAISSICTEQSSLCYAVKIIDKYISLTILPCGDIRVKKYKSKMSEICYPTVVIRSENFIPRTMWRHQCIAT